MINLINTASNFCVNFTRKFKCVGLVLAVVALTNFACSKAMNELHKACEICDVQKVKELIDKDVNINAVFTAGRYKGYAPLHIACQNGHKDIKGIIKLLLEHGANANATVTTGFYIGITPFHIACQNGHKDIIEIIELLLENGANPNTVFTDERNRDKTPLHFACQNDHKDIKAIIQLLLEHGANIDQETLEQLQINLQDPEKQTVARQIQTMFNFVSDFLKEAEKGSFYRDKFASENKEHEQFLEKVRKAHLHNGNKKMEPASLEKYPAKADRYNDSRVIVQ